MKKVNNTLLFQVSLSLALSLLSSQVQCHPCETELYMSHIISSLLHRNGFLSVSSAVLRWLSQLHPGPVLYEWWQGATGFHWDLIKCEGPCGCSLIERRFNRAAQGRLIHQPATNQRALGYRWQWWRTQWLTQWRCASVCLHMRVYASTHRGNRIWGNITSLSPALTQTLKRVMFESTDMWYLIDVLTELHDIRWGLLENGRRKNH